MSRAWLEQRERGTLGALRLIASITNGVGYRAGRALLYPISLYFVVFSTRSRAASRAFLARALGRAPRWREVFRHYHTFASTLLDRVDILSGRLGRFDITIYGREAVEAALRNGRGCLLFGAHLGSFELVRALADDHRALVVSVVMHEANADMIGRWAREMSPALAARIIAPGQVGTLLRVRECLERGETVAMLADRPIGAGATRQAAFFDAPAAFPIGPFQVALTLGVPVVLFFGLYRDARCYDIHFETFEPGSRVHRAEQATALERMIERYAQRLESYARRYPWNWFNFYDFWRQE
jgi:predicted LPLAT superfamily acyltransferase